MKNKVLIVLFAILITSCESYFCERNKHYYKKEFAGWIIKKYTQNIQGRDSDFLVFANSKDTIIWQRPYPELWNECKINDSIVKRHNSVLFELYRNGKLLIQDDEDRSCDYLLAPAGDI